MKIAELLGKSRQTIYNEINRGKVQQMRSNLTTYKVYKADYAQLDYDRKKILKGRDLKIGSDLSLCRKIANLIKRKYSPYAITQFLKHECYLSVSTIYRYVYNGIFLGVTDNDLRYQKHKKHKAQSYYKPIRLRMAQSIETRDKSVFARDVFGHWEMDTVYSGKDKSKACLLVLTERMTRYELVVPMVDRTSASTTFALSGIREKLCGQFGNIFKSITCDNGGEFFDYKSMGTDVYYCHPYCSGERGSNECQNKLIRYHIPKGEDIAKYSCRELRNIQEYINTLPRKLFNGLSSMEVLRQTVSDTVFRLLNQNFQQKMTFFTS